MHKCLQRSLLSCLLAASLPLVCLAVEVVPATAAPLAVNPVCDLASVEALLGSGRLAEFGAEAEKAAATGSPRGCFLAALAYDFGLGRRRDVERGADLLDRSVQGGDALASAYRAWRSATCYGSVEDRSIDEESVPQDPPVGKLPGCQETLSAPLQRYFTTEGGGLRPQVKRLLLLLNELADSGDVMARANLAGLSTSRVWGRDLQVHRYWLKLASDGGDLLCMRQYAYCLENGVGVLKNPAAALDLYRRAAASGDTESQVKLAEKLDGKGRTEAEYQEALKWLRQASAAGNVDARVNLILMLRDGRLGVPVDLVESRQVGHAGYQDKQAAPAKWYGDCLLDGHGGPMDKAAAVSVYEQAVAWGSSKAMHTLGYVYYSGALGAPDYDKAITWYMRAGEAGETLAFRDVGLMHDKGEGRPVSKNLSFFWFDKAARLGDVWSQVRVGWMLRNGVGVAADSEEAIVWFLAAEAQGDLDALSHLAYHHINGMGTPKDNRTAFVKLVKRLRISDDAWSSDLFLTLFSEKCIDTLAEDRLLALVKDPSLLECKTRLPLLCLHALDMLGRSEFGEVRADYVQALRATQRPELAETLARRAFLGVDGPPDLKLALEFAGRIPGEGNQQARFVANEFLSMAGETAQQKAEAVLALEEQAKAGFAPAVRLLARRAVDGIAQPSQGINYRPWIRAAKIKARPLLNEHGKQRPADKDFAAELAKVEKEVDVAAALVPPKVFWKPVPFYPREMAKARLSQQFMITFDVDAEGRVANIQVPKGVHPLFAEAARAHADKWLFVPGFQKGRRVALKNIRMPIRFLAAEDAYTDE